MTDGMIIPITQWPPCSYRIKPSPHPPPPPPHPTVEGQAFPISVQREGTACFSVKMFVDGVSACVGTLSHQKQSAVASFPLFWLLLQLQQRDRSRMDDKFSPACMIDIFQFTLIYTSFAKYTHAHTCVISLPPHSSSVSESERPSSMTSLSLTQPPVTLTASSAPSMEVVSMGLESIVAWRRWWWCCWWWVWGWRWRWCGLWLLVPPTLLLLLMLPQPPAAAAAAAASACLSVL